MNVQLEEELSIEKFCVFQRRFLNFALVSNLPLCV